MSRPLVLGCILTGQPIPNFLSVHHYLGEANSQNRSRKLLLFQTEEMAGQKRHEHFKRALEISGLDESACSPEVVSLGAGDQSPQDFKSAFEETFKRFGSGHELVLNITGGTKMISIGAYQAGVAAGAKLVYVPEGKSTTLRVLDGESMEMDARKLLVPAFLAAYGYEAASTIPDYYDRWQRLGAAACDSLKGDASPIIQPAPSEEEESTQPPQADLRKRLREGGKLAPGDRILVRSGAMRTRIEEEWPAPRPWQFNKEFLEGKRLDKELGCYLTGGWLEAALFSALSRRGTEIGIRDVHTSLVVRKGMTQNEFDVAFMRGTTLCTVECKSGNQSHVGANPLNDLYKAEATLNPLKALHTKVWYVTTAKALYQKKEGTQLETSIENRAKLNGWTLIPPHELKKLGECEPGSSGELEWLRRHFAERTP